MTQKNDISFFLVIFYFFSEIFSFNIHEEVWGQTITSFWARSGPPKAVLGTGFHNKNNMFFLYAFFYIFGVFFRCPSRWGARIYKFGHVIPTLTHFWARVRHFPRIRRFSKTSKFEKIMNTDRLWD